MQVPHLALPLRRPRQKLLHEDPGAVCPDAGRFRAADQVIEQRAGGQSDREGDPDEVLQGYVHLLSEHLPTQHQAQGH